MTLEELLSEVEEFGRSNVATWVDYENFKRKFASQGFEGYGKEIADALNL